MIITRVVGLQEIVSREREYETSITVNLRL